MKEKIEAQEALAESYEELADAETDVDDEINQLLGSNSQDSLNELKGRMKNSPQIESNSSNTPSQESESLKNLKQKLKDNA